MRFATNEAQVALVDRALVPSERSAPNRSLLVASWAAVAGFVAMIATLVAVCTPPRSSMTGSPPTVRGFIQARMSSARFPGKVLAPFRGRPVIAWVIDAARARSEPTRRFSS